MGYILGIDPGIEGFFVLTNGENVALFRPMPIKVGAKNREIDFDGVRLLLSSFIQPGLKIDHVYMERAMALAMGSSHAFNYGRGFAALEIALHLSKLPVTQVLPQAWQKEMFEGTSAELKSKARALVAVERLFPRIFDLLPKNMKGIPKDGAVDSLLIAGFGLRKFRPA